MVVLIILLKAIGIVCEMVLQIILIIVAARIVLSWFSPDPYNPLVQSMYRITEPMLRPFRKLTKPLLSTGIDFSPMLLGIALVVLKMVIADSVTAAIIALSTP